MKFRAALLASALPIAAHAQCAPPSPAAAAGYNLQTFNGTQLGKNFLPVTGDNASSGVTQNSDGSISIRGGDANHYNDQINTGDQQFGGGALIQATLAFQNSPGGWYQGADGWPAFWGTSTSSGAHVETDFFEFMTQGVSNKFDFGLQDWQSSTSVTWAGDGGYGVPTAAWLPANFDPSQPHRYAFLWVPAKNGNPGYAKMFVDDQPVGPTYTWNGPNDPWGSIDNNRLQIILGTGSANPMTVYNVQVWQASAADDTGLTSASTDGGSCFTAPIATVPPTTLLQAALPDPASSAPTQKKQTQAPTQAPAIVPSGETQTTSVEPSSVSSARFLPSGFVASPPSQSAPPVSTTDSSVSLAPFAMNGCKGETFFEDFSKGTSGWNLGNNGTPSSSGVISDESNTSGIQKTANGLNMSVIPAGNGFAGSWMDTGGKFSQQNGYFEATINVPKGQGLTGAFWLTGTKSWPPEIDVAETDSTSMTSSLHSAVTSDASGHYAPIQAGTHVYAVNWTPQTITWYTDGQITHQASTPSDFNQPMMLVLDMMASGPDSYNGTPAPGTTATMQVENVRAFSSMEAALACVPNAPGPTAQLVPQTNLSSALTGAQQ